jgi:hypothetical protein
LAYREENTKRKWGKRKGRKINGKMTRKGDKLIVKWGRGQKGALGINMDV